MLLLKTQSENIKNYIKTIENKSICLFKIEEYLYDVLDDIHIELKIKNIMKYYANIQKLQGI